MSSFPVIPIHYPPVPVLYYLSLLEPVFCSFSATLWTTHFSASLISAEFFSNVILFLTFSSLLADVHAVGNFNSLRPLIWLLLTFTNCNHSSDVSLSTLNTLSNLFLLCFPQIKVNNRRVVSLTVFSSQAHWQVQHIKLLLDLDQYICFFLLSGFKLLCWT